MERKRREAKGRAGAAQASPERDVAPWLRQLGFRPEEVRRAVVACEAIPGASLEERLRFALAVLQPPHRRVRNGQVAGTRCAAVSHGSQGTSPSGP